MDVVAPRRQASRKSHAAPLLDRQVISTAEGALPVHTRISVLYKDDWEPGFVTSSYSCLNGNRAVMCVHRDAPSPS